jgi:hypothetical protein
MISHTNKTVGPGVKVIDFLVENYELPFTAVMALDERNMTAVITALQLVHNLLVPDRSEFSVNFL